MNSSNLTDQKAISVRVIHDGVIGNSLMVIMAILGLIMSIAMLLTIYLWKPLRDMHQILVINAAMADAIKSISYAVPGLKRLILAATGYDEVIDQFDCMFWIFPLTFTTLYGLSSVLTLSLERLAVIAVPVWYWKHKRRFMWTLVIISFFISFLSGLGLFMGASRDLLFLSCNLMSSTTLEYYQFMVTFQDVTTGGIIFVNVLTALLLWRRWRAAIRAKMDMKEFKNEIQLNAIKAVFSVVVLCLASFFAGMVFMTAIQNFDVIRKAFYGPFWGCLQMMRGVFDFGLWVIFSSKYRKAFVEVFVKRNIQNGNNVVPVVVDVRSGVSSGWLVNRANAHV